MGVDLYCKFKQPLTSKQLSDWALELFTDHDLKRAQKQFADYQEANVIHPYDAGQIAWEKVNNGPYVWLFNHFFGEYEWDVATLGRRWFINDIKVITGDKYIEEYKGNFYLASCGALDQDQSTVFAWKNSIKLNGDGQFPIIALDYFYWG